MRIGGWSSPARGIGGPVSRRLALVFFLAAMVLAGGCTEVRPEGSDSAPPPEILVDYTRTGGIAGFSDHLVVFENGQVVYDTHSGSGLIMLDEPTRLELRDLLEAADFPNLSAEYPAKTTGADYFTYLIIYRNKAVMTETTGIPPCLEPLISSLDSILQFSGL